MLATTCPLFSAQAHAQRRQCLSKALRALRAVSNGSALRVDAHSITSAVSALAEREKTSAVAQVGSRSVTPMESASSRSVSAVAAGASR